MIFLKYLHNTCLVVNPFNVLDIEIVFNPTGKINDFFF